MNSKTLLKNKSDETFMINKKHLLNNKKTLIK